MTSNKGIHRPANLPAKLRDQLQLCFSHPDEVMFLDLETTGLSHYYDEITIIGWTFGGKANTVVKGSSNEDFLRDLKTAIAIVSFNGIRFDVKFLRKELPHAEFPSTHIDLMYLCRRVGLVGGQKAIEDELDITLRREMHDIDGAAAVLLWHRYLRGESEALANLIRYNRCDIAAMGFIFDEALDRLNFSPDLFGKPIKFRNYSAPKEWDKLPNNLSPASSDLNNTISFKKIFGKTKASKSRIVGIDLTGSEKRPTGWCFLNGHKAETTTISNDEEIIAKTVNSKPDLISIDSPLCLPRGRQTVFDDDPNREKYGIMRECERELKRRGVNVYPSLLPSMQKLTARGIKIADTFRKRGIPVIESYPGAAQDIMRIPRKGAGVKWLKAGLGEFGIFGKFLTEEVTHDELDAITSALVGTFHLAGLSEELGGKDEPPLIIPSLSAKQKPCVVGVSGPLAAGKTTIARLFEGRGYSYTRFSLVIDDILDERGQEKTRNNRQSIGIMINKENRQRELAERTIRKASGSPKIVVDGLRYPEDYAFLFESFGFQFTHIYVDAEFRVRKSRYISRLEQDNSADVFENASNAEVECRVPELKFLADKKFLNNGSKSDIECFVESVHSKISKAPLCQ